MSITQKRTAVSMYAISMNVYWIRKELSKGSNSQWMGLA